MSDCERHRTAMERCFAGELDTAALASLVSHCGTCASCRGLLELHRDLAGLASDAAPPSTATLDRMQSEVLQRITREAKGMRGPGRRSGEGASERGAAANSGRGIFGGLTSGRAFGIAALIAASAVLFFAGRWTGRENSSQSTARTSADVSAFLVAALGDDASANHALRDVEGSSFTYSNVSFRRADGDRVILGFDLTTHVEVIEPVRSPLVQEALVQSLINPSSVGTTLKAMSYAAGAMAPKVREALIFALGRDENLAVRLEALTVLSDHLSEPEVQRAVIDALRDDESVQVRLLALEYLASHDTDPGRIREVLRERDRPGDEALIVRLAEYEKEI